VSLAGSRSGIEGTAGAVVSMVMVNGADGADTLPNGVGGSRGDRMSASGQSAGCQAGTGNAAAVPLATCVTPSKFSQYYQLPPCL